LAGTNIGARRLIPFAIAVALFMENLDSTIIATSVPAIAHSLGTTPLNLSMAVSVYLLSLAIFIPMSGWMADKYGPRTVFAGAIAMFTVSSALCGLSQSLGMLVAARALQGVGGAMMMPVGRLVLLRSVPKHELVQAMSYLTMPAMLGPVLGPPVGGFIVTHFSWRWIFFINIPMGILGVILVSLFIRNIREETTTPLDWRGFILTGFGLAGVVYGFDNLGRGVLPLSVVTGLLLGGAVCLAAYFFHAKRTAHAILDLSVLRIQTFAASVIGGAFMRMGMGALPFLLAMLLQMGFGMNAQDAGLTTFTAAAGALLMKTTARPIIRWFGFKRVLIGNQIVTGVILMGYALFQVNTPHILIIATLLIGGFFRSLQFTALNTLAFADISQPQMSRASSLSSMGQQLSQSIGIGLAAMLLSSLRSMHGSTVLHAADVSPVFVILGAISMLSLFYFVPLPRDAGAEVSGHRVEPRPEPASSLPPTIEPAE